MCVCLVAAFAGDLLLASSIHKICERSEAAIDPKSLISLCSQLHNPQNPLTILPHLDSFPPPPYLRVVIL